MKKDPSLEMQLALIRHRLDQITRPKFEREDIELLLTEIVRLRSREARANDRAEEELYRMNDMLGTITSAHEQLSRLMEENQALHAQIAAWSRPPLGKLSMVTQPPPQIVGKIRAIEDETPF